MTVISLGTKLFSRTERLQRLLESVSAVSISTVHAAHDGEWDDKKRDVLNADYQFELSILNLQYIAGSEHLNFHVGHWKQTNWSFATNPSVTFEHYPGGSQSYLTNRHGENVSEEREYFRRKWGYGFVRDQQAFWFDTETPSFTTAVCRAVSQQLPTSVYKRAKSAYDTLGYLRHR